MPWIWTEMKFRQFSPYARFHCRTITKSERTGDNGWYMVIWIHMSRLDMIWTCAPAWTLWNLWSRMPRMTWSPTSAWDSRILTETVGLPPESLMCLFSLTSSSDNSDLKQVNWLNWLTTCWLLEVFWSSILRWNFTERSLDLEKLVQPNIVQQTESQPNTPTYTNLHQLTTCYFAYRNSDLFSLCFPLCQYRSKFRSGSLDKHFTRRRHTDSPCMIFVSVWLKRFLCSRFCKESTLLLGFLGDQLLLTSLDLDIDILSLVCHFFLGIYSGFAELSMWEELAPILPSTLQLSDLIGIPGLPLFAGTAIVWSTEVPMACTYIITGYLPY